MPKVIIKHKYMKFKRKTDKWKRVFWECFDIKHNILRGYVKLYGVAPSMSWLFSPGHGTLFPPTDLQDICDFIKQLTEDKDNE